MTTVLAAVIFAALALYAHPTTRGPSEWACSVDCGAVAAALAAARVPRI